MGLRHRRLFVATLALVVLVVEQLAGSASASFMPVVTRRWAGVGMRIPEGRRFSSTEARWVVPDATCEGVQYSDSRVGVGLDGGMGKHPLGQIGTGALCWKGVAKYYAWSEVLPGTGAQNVKDHDQTGRDDLRVTPGDKIMASVTLNYVGGPLPAAPLRPGATSGGLVQSYDFTIDVASPNGSSHSSRFNVAPHESVLGGLYAECSVEAPTNPAINNVTRFTQLSPVRISQCQAEEDGSGITHFFTTSTATDCAGAAPCEDPTPVHQWQMWDLKTFMRMAATRINGPGFRPNPNGVTVRWTNP